MPERLHPSPGAIENTGGCHGNAREAPTLWVFLGEISEVCAAQAHLNASTINAGTTTFGATAKAGLSTEMRAGSWLSLRESEHLTEYRRVRGYLME